MLRALASPYKSSSSHDVLLLGAVGQQLPCIAGGTKEHAAGGELH